MVTRNEFPIDGQKFLQNQADNLCPRIPQGDCVIKYTNTMSHFFLGLGKSW